MTLPDMCVHNMRAGFCHHCDNRPPTGRYPHRPTVVQARYDDAPCHICDNYINRGDDIVAETDTGGWIHADCNTWDIEWDDNQP